LNTFLRSEARKAFWAPVVIGIYFVLSARTVPY